MSTSLDDPPPPPPPPPDDDSSVSSNETVSSGDTGTGSSGKPIWEMFARIKPKPPVEDYQPSPTPWKNARASLAKSLPPAGEKTEEEDGPPVPKYPSQRMIMPSPAPSPVLIARKDPSTFKSLASDNDSTSQTDEQRLAREQTRITRLVNKAKQQQSFAAAWFAASSGDSEDILPPILPRRPSRRRPQPRDGRNSPSGTSTTLPSPGDGQSVRSCPIDLDSGEIWNEQQKNSKRSFWWNLLTGGSSRTFTNSLAATRTLEGDGDANSDVGVEEGEQGRRKKAAGLGLCCSPRLIISFICACLLCAMVLMSITIVRSRQSKFITVPAPTSEPTSAAPSPQPSMAPTSSPSIAPSRLPSQSPTPYPSTLHPTIAPSRSPSAAPSAAPSRPPSASPSATPSSTPSAPPTTMPTVSVPPSSAPSQSPTTVFSTKVLQQVAETITGDIWLDHFGFSLSLSQNGEFLAIGTRYGEEKKGFVEVFRRSGDSWFIWGSPIFGRNLMDQFGSSVAISNDGTRVAVSEPTYSKGVAGLRAGNVRVFLYLLDQWVQIGGDIEGEYVGELFGSSLQISGDGNRVIAGTPYHDNSDDRDKSGRVRVFELNRGKWTQIGQSLDGPAFNDWLGWSCDINESGSRVVVGAPRHAAGGFARVYEWNNRDQYWDQLGGSLMNDYDIVQPNDRFGMSVSIDGDRVAVGGPYKDANGEMDSGFVKVFEWDKNRERWNPVGQVLTGEGRQELFGWAVSLFGDNLAVGIPGYEMNRGKVLLYKWNSEMEIWDVAQPLYGDAALDAFGFSVSGNNDFFAVGAPISTGRSDAELGYTRMYHVS